ncbi:MAG: CBS domain-containing protein, partial [Chloroflexota bacterium]|nr:CBS domain-containing protein [Chloroflexota bacterium]
LVVPWTAVVQQKGKTLLLSVAAGAWAPHVPEAGEIWLARAVQDRRVVDAGRAKLVRVNAIAMDERDGVWLVLGIEVGARGLLERLGLPGLANALGLKQEVVPWSDVGLTGAHSSRLEQMHPAEIAAIVHDLPPAQGSDLVEALTDEMAADTLEEVHPDRQADLLEDMAPERAADILEEMAPDEAADVLQDMSGEKAQELLDLMEDEPAAEAAELLAHREDSAGGLMTTEYATLPPDLTAAQALDELRKRYAGERDDFHYVYITDEQEHVLGVTSLWDLIMADPAARLMDFAETKVISVRPEQEAEEAARLISRYNILAIPVVDAENRLQGIVTVDDAMDLILPEDWRGRLPHMH